MKKKITEPKQTKDITPIVGTKYIILPDNTVAKRLKSRIQHGTTRFNLWINNKFTTIAVDELRAWNDERAKSQSGEETDTDTSES
jgi:hypothetical protein